MLSKYYEFTLKASLQHRYNGLCELEAMGFEEWSGREDLNLRPQRPERCALPNCATPRNPFIIG
jgi:hypothetical protein